MSNPITQILPIQIIDHEECNPFYVVWENSAGAFSYWMFEFNQRETFNVDQGEVFERTIFNLETAEGTFEAIEKTANRSITVEATSINENELRALSEINSSPKIYQMFKLVDSFGNAINRNPDGTPKRIELLALSKSVSRSTRAVRYNIQFEFGFPRIFLQTQQ